MKTVPTGKKSPGAVVVQEPTDALLKANLVALRVGAESVGDFLGLSHGVMMQRHWLMA
jgi:hypothetical protein